MSTNVHVSIDIHGETLPVGVLYVHRKSSHELFQFEYHSEWLSRSEKFEIDPAIGLTEGPHVPAQGHQYFGAIGDSAPDTWGRRLMLRNEVIQAKNEKRRAKTLSEMDYLLGVLDYARMGALRFSLNAAEPYLAERTNNDIPPIVDIRRLMNASIEYEKAIESGEPDSMEQPIRDLIAPGSSLGGARPKASVIDNDGSLAIAKFESQKDEYSVIGWENLTLHLAKKCGIDVAESRIENVAGNSVMISKRFDRDEDNRRIPFLSAMSALQAKDGEHSSYAEIADFVSRHGAKPTEDRKNIFQRAAFNTLVSNVDDHLRNHAFVMSDEGGWVLSRAYDINPVAREVKRNHSTLFFPGVEDPSLSSLLTHHEYFGLKEDEACEMIYEMASITKDWRKAADNAGLKKECLQLESAFEHDDLEFALSFGDE